METEIKKILNTILYDDITNIILEYLRCDKCKNIDPCFCICFECNTELCVSCNMSRYYLCLDCIYHLGEHIGSFFPFRYIKNRL